MSRETVSLQASKGRIKQFDLNFSKTNYSKDFCHLLHKHAAEMQRNTQQTLQKPLRQPEDVFKVKISVLIYGAVQLRVGNM